MIFNWYLGWQILKEFLIALPDLLTLVRVVLSKLNEIETDRKVSDDIKSLHQAIAAGDASQVQHIFNTPAK